MLNSENLLVLFVPVIFIYGVGLFIALLDQINLKIREVRLLIVGVFGVLMCLPMVFIFLPPKTVPLVYPPYYPPAIQQTCNWMKPNELMMSDIPWAMAWYGNRQCIWLTQNAESEFFAVHDLLKPVRAVYLTPQTTLDNRFLSQSVRAGEHSWASFILESILRNHIPGNVPLRKVAQGFFPEQLFLTDWERWKAPPPGALASPPEAGKDKVLFPEKEMEKK